MIAIDFEKAFDTLDFQFLIRTLHKFNFGPSFIQWMRVLYKNASSCVMNNGFTTGPFLRGRGVRQGDPLSPFLFILALETLAIKIREDFSVQGLKIGEEMIKLSLFADDMTCLIKDNTSYTILLFPCSIFFPSSTILLFSLLLLLLLISIVFLRKGQRGQNQAITFEFGLFEGKQ